MVDEDADPTNAICRASLKGTPAFRHPLLRIAANLGSAPKTYREFHRLVRLALAERPGSARHVQLSVEVLEKLGKLELDSLVAAQFTQEWLSASARDSRSPRLIEALFLSELKIRDLELDAKAWRPSVGSTGVRSLPFLRTQFPDAGGIGRKAKLPEEPAELLLKCVELAQEADLQGSIAKWKAEDCKASIRAIAALACNEVGSFKLRAELDRADFFRSIGVALWNSLAKRLRVVDASEEAKPYQDGSLLRAIALHLQGVEYLSREGVTEESGEDLSRTSASSDSPLQLRVVKGEIAEPTHREDKEVVRQYEVLCRPVPVARMPTAEDVRDLLGRLAGEFPWASSVVDELSAMLQTRSLFGVQALHLSPVLLVGAPGCGKTRLVRRLSELLSLPFMPIALGGLNDSKPFVGTSRGWAAGEPSPLLNTMLRHRSASALVLLDELDKCTNQSFNSPAVPSVLLGLLEPESAQRWRDNFLQTECDLSRLIFWATANNLGAVSRPLLSRFTVIHMPSPRDSDKHVLVKGILADIEKEWALPAGVLPEPPWHVYSGVPLNARELRRLILHFLKEWSAAHLASDKLH